MLRTHRGIHTRRAWSGVLAAGVLVTTAVFVVTTSTVGNVSAVPKLTPRHVVAVGGDHTCVIYGSTSQLRCWGDNSSGQLGVSSSIAVSTTPRTPSTKSGATLVPVTGVVDVATGSSHTCAALTTGVVKCWGSNFQGGLGRGPVFSSTPSPTPTPVQGLAGVKAVRVAAGFEHSCALLSNFTVRCWGADDEGQLGNNSLVAVGTAVAVPGISNAIAITTGKAHSCALLSNRTVKCWGRGAEGQLGRNSVALSKVPVAVSGINSAIAITAGGNHTCALLALGTVKCWGENAFGQLGNNTRVNSKVPVAVATLTGATSIGAGYDHTCARLANGTAKCWGDNASGELGDNTHLVRTKPIAVLGLTGASAIAAGDGVTCAALANATAKCWGYNASGQLGNGVLATNHFPVPVFGLTTGVTRIAAGGSHTCAVVKGGVKCWGTNAFGQLGNGSRVYSATPVQVTGLLSTNTVKVVDVSSGSNFSNDRAFSCALLSNGAVKCWGDNSRFQLGRTTPAFSMVPLVVPAIDGSNSTKKAKSISAGFQHVCAVMTTGSVKCWGDNGSEELGGGVSSGLSRSAAPVLTAISALQVAAGGDFTCAIVVGGKVQCWGNNDFGQVDSANIPLTSPSPVDVIEFDGLTAATSASKLTAGFGHACAVSSGGNMACWGDSFDGQGSFVDVVPTGLASISAGPFHTCIVVVGVVGGFLGTLECLGQNFDGQLGQGNIVDSLDTLVDVRVRVGNVLAVQTGATRVTSSDSFTCAVIAGGAKCWGANQVGQLGDGKTNSAKALLVKLAAGVRQP